ncbi:hypothetical protein FGO68_gene9432 [Halteria grandinella]|uniref:Guanylyl cyclase n=1 Tax=Halteria grandinella TaxID=5974 RepID=A0A8J8SZC3_HALGN|nr:hypothetical protein FGO68_gene9432 [Halteria grandinella]
MDPAIDTFDYSKFHLQKGDWDCGPSCIILFHQYLLLTQNPDSPPPNLEDTYSFFDPCSQMIFTIDLFDYFATKLTTHKVLFTTVELGFAESHSQLDYYKNSTSFQSRVKQVFEKYKGDGRVAKESVELARIVEFLSQKKGVLIVLIDSDKKATFPEDDEGTIEVVQRYITTAFNRVFAREGHYAGHYALAVAADEKNIFYLNPSSRGMYKISHKNFDYCRKARGTDEDLIFIYTS